MKLNLRSLRRWRDLRLQKLALRIEALDKPYRQLPTQEIRKRSLSLRYQALAGEPLERLLPTAFALVRESAARVLGMRHYDVQLIGGIGLHFGRIAVMQTGEGKTLTATLPLYLAALQGRGAHLLTANDYLARRDADLVRPLFELLGLSVAAIGSESSPQERQRAYASDITYSTAKEVGFDFLRDRLQKRMRLLGMNGKGNGSGESLIVQRDFHFAVVDEADNILIDEARTPLVVSGQAEGCSDRTPLYRWAAKACRSLESPTQVVIHEARRQLELTAAGRQLARRLAATPEVAQFPLQDLYEQLELALLVSQFYQRDRQYIVRNGEVIIVDEFTGRLAEGRKWRAGLHQAIEAHEGLEITEETDEVARITIQDLFLKYPRLAGMTGTLGNSAVELKTIYRTPVLEVPTHRPPRRIAYPEVVTRTELEKWERIADEVAQLHAVGRPVLIGTRSIDKSRQLSAVLERRGIPHSVLNAKEHEQEAEIIAQAGQFRRVTVATNMAGRGTDIKLDTAALELGGLHVIGSELHDSARIDRQLIGRCGRQGDPGSYRQYMSLEDDLLAAGLSERHWRSLKGLVRSTSPLSAQLARHFRLAQRRLEQRHFSARKILMFQEKSRQELQSEMGQDPYLDAAG